MALNRINIAFFSLCVFFNEILINVSFLFCRNNGIRKYFVLGLQNIRVFFFLPIGSSFNFRFLKFHISFTIDFSLNQCIYNYCYIIVSFLLLLINDLLYCWKKITRFILYILELAIAY